MGWGIRIDYSWGQRWREQEATAKYWEEYEEAVAWLEEEEGA